MSNETETMAKAYAIVKDNSQSPWVRATALREYRLAEVSLTGKDKGFFFVLEEIFKEMARLELHIEDLENEYRSWPPGDCEFC